MASLGVEVVILMDQRVLLVLRDDFNVWALPGGGVDPNESLVQAAMREVREETGLVVTLSRLVGFYSRPDWCNGCLLYTSPSPRDKRQSRMPSSA